MRAPELLSLEKAGGRGWQIFLLISARLSEEPLASMQSSWATKGSGRFLPEIRKPRQTFLLRKLCLER